MKRLLCLVVGAVVFIATNVSLAVADETLIGKIKWIFIDKDYHIAIRIVSTITNRSYLWWSDADSPLVPVITMAYQTQSTCKFYSLDNDLSGAEIKMIEINREDSITNDNVMDELEEIKDKLEEIEARMSIRPVWRQR